MKILFELDIDDVFERDPKRILSVIREAVTSRLRPPQLKVRYIGKNTTWPAPKSTKYLLDSKNDIYIVAAGETFDGTPGAMVRY